MLWDFQHFGNTLGIERDIPQPHHGFYRFGPIVCHGS